MVDKVVFDVLSVEDEPDTVEVVKKVITGDVLEEDEVKQFSFPHKAIRLRDAHKWITDEWEELDEDCEVIIHEVDKGEFEL